jgi:DegT/DnrJ/EryC1/StrS aminotransferase family/GDP-mannose 4,6 dehydratase
MQAALGLSQLNKLDGFVQRRKENFTYLFERLQGVGGLTLPRAHPHSDPAWFGFPIILTSDLATDREDLMRYLEARKVSTRLIFAGNLLGQPAYQGIDCRIVRDLRNSDTVMRRSSGSASSRACLTACSTMPQTHSLTSSVGGAAATNMHFLVESHTGFKGAWLTLMLTQQGTPSPDRPRTRSWLARRASEVVTLLLRDLRVDIRDVATTQDAITATKPDVVLHLAAQPLVRESYRNPAIHTKPTY